MTQNSNRPVQPVPQLEIVPASRADTDRTAAVLAEAFATDPHVVGLLPHGDVLEALTLLWRRIIREAFAAGGHVYLAVRPGEERPLGAALWTAPGTKVSFPRMLPGVVSYARIFRTRFPDALATELLTQRAQPTSPHWYLKALATAPGAQGTGVGSRLLEDRLADIDRQHAGAYLEASTTDLVPYYERFGFRSRGPVACRGTVPAIGMWRPPAD
ncbi:GNAT family N-acetyltransferase [Kocuria sp. KSNUG]|uniref:GNAT family N-acetyltransferase n=1 Tax=Kocuria sp. KSNUG TaxID=3136676 RepID=UPI003C2EC6BD